MLDSKNEENNMKYTFNDGGRSEHYKGLTGDCVTRAITIATKLPYDVVYNALFHIAKNWKGNYKMAKRIRLNPSPRNGCFNEVSGEFLKGLKIEEVRTRVKVNDPMFYKGRYIVYVRRHYLAIIDGVVHDTWDSRKTSGKYTKDLLGVPIPQWKTATRYWKIK